MTTSTTYPAESADASVLSPQQADDLLRGAAWRRFAVLGDSMAEGIMEATEGYQTACWADRVHAALLRGNPELEFLNTGWRGVLSGQVREDQLPKALAFEPDLAAVICGGNDFLAQKFDASAYQENLEAIVGPLVEAGATVILFSLINITAAIPELVPMRSRMERLNAASLAVAQKYGAVWVPTWEHPASADRAVYSSDMLHLSARGHAIVATETLHGLGRLLGNEQAPAQDAAPGAAEGSVESISGVYDYLLGGSDHNADERQVAERVLASVPGIKVLVWEDRKFIKRLVRFFAREGITQILDLGCGIPSRGTVHRLAHAVNPDIKVVYADVNEVAVERYRELIAGEPNVWAVKADLTRPQDVLGLAEVRELDFTQPIAVMLLGVLHFIPSDVLEPAMRAYREALAPGSMIAFSHGAGTKDTDGVEAYQVYAEAFGFATMRDEHDLVELLGDFELVEPGVVKLPDWRPDPSPFSARYADVLGPVHYLGAVAVKPGAGPGEAGTGAS